MRNKPLVFHDPIEFAAVTAAEAWLTRAGFSYGSMERGKPIGVLFGDYIISKWRNMSEDEQDDLHGVMIADSYRHGRVSVDLYADAPQEAIEAFDAARATVEHATGKDAN